MQYPATLVPEAGWHFLHLFYQVDRRALGLGVGADADSYVSQMIGVDVSLVATRAQ